MVIKEGIFTAGNLSFMMIADNIVIVGSIEHLSDQDIRDIKNMFAVAMNQSIDNAGIISFKANFPIKLCPNANLCRNLSIVASSLRLMI